MNRELVLFFLQKKSKMVVGSLLIIFFIMALTLTKIKKISGDKKIKDSIEEIERIAGKPYKNIRKINVTYSKHSHLR